MHRQLTLKNTKLARILGLAAFANLVLLGTLAAFTFRTSQSQSLLILLFLLTGLGVVATYRYSKRKIDKLNTLRHTLFEQLAEAQTISKIGSWEWDLESNHISWSSEHYRIFEIPEPQEPEDLHRLLRNSIHSEDLGKLDQLFDDFKPSGKKFTYDFRLVFPNGRIKYAQMNATVTRDQAGTAILFSGTCQDITDRKRTRAALRASEAFNLSILNSVASEIAVLDRDGTIIAVNEPWRRFSLENSIEPGKPVPNAEVGANYLSICQSGIDSTLDEDALSAQNGIRAVLAGDLPSFSLEYPCHSPDEQRWFSLSVTPLGSEGRGVVVSHTKITERKQAEIELRQIQASRLASLSELSAGIAHEINNPLTIISGSARQLPKLADNPEKLAAKIATIEKASSRIAKIVGGLKKFSRSSEVINYRPHVLSEIVKEALLLTEIKSVQYSTPVICDLKSDSYIHCDEVEIEQVLINLIYNSIDAVKDRGERWVMIEAEEETDSVVLRVSDSGPGIPEKIRAKIFAPFFTTKAVGEGTGLGLSITKGILDQHRATITVLANAPNTCFEIRFPKAAAEQAS